MTTAADITDTWMLTRSGVRFNLLSPREADFLIEDVAHPLSLLCRFGGHCRKFYSVAQHSLLVAKLLPDELKLSGLLHDAAEAYLVDVPRPVKSLLGTYQAFEQLYQKRIANAFRPTRDSQPLAFNHPEVLIADNVALVTEKRDLMAKSPWEWPGLEGIEPHAARIFEMSSERAEYEFLLEYDRLVDLTKRTEATQRGHHYGSIKVKSMDLPKVEGAVK